jgi:hypothetical protein
MKKIEKMEIHFILLYCLSVVPIFHFKNGFHHFDQIGSWPNEEMTT